VWAISISSAGCFRDGERGRAHNVEFTLLEWYRVGADHHALMDEVAEFLRALLGAARVDPVERITFRAALERHAAIDPFSASGADCVRCLEDAGIPLPAERERDALLDLIVGEIVGPKLGRAGACFVYDYPADRPALARIRAAAPPVAERFEIYLDGLELANGFHELTDALEQRAAVRAGSGPARTRRTRPRADRRAPARRACSRTPGVRRRRTRLRPPRDAGRGRRAHRRSHRLSFGARVSARE
jgi:lysyl-tRNA synthetase class 2